jgi:uncharacterized protein (UPF0210 family)
MSVRQPNEHGVRQSTARIDAAVETVQIREPMLQIRSITLGVDASWPLSAEITASAATFFAHARKAFEAEKVAVQTTRLCTQPAHRFVTPAQLPEFAAALQAACVAHAIPYAAVGGIQLGGAWTEATAVEAIIDAIVPNDRVFSSLQVAQDSAIDYAAARAAGAVIAGVAQRTAHGFGNLRFTAAAQCPANIPFFPASWHGGGDRAFSLALQLASVVVEAFAKPGSLDAAEARLVAAIEEHGEKLSRVAEAIERDTGARFVGIDLSPAPFPVDFASAAGALEQLGVARFGGAGTVLAAWRLTSTLKRARVRRCGFSGLMMPVLEDSVLAKRCAEGLLSINELLLFSTICGTGLDTVPLPGDVSEAELAAILLDVAALATALAKPLTARLFPVPGKRAGDEAKFDFPFFVPSRVLAVKGHDAAALIARALGES